MCHAPDLFVSMVPTTFSDHDRGHAAYAIAPTPRAMTVLACPDACDQNARLTFGEFLEGRNRADREAQVDPWRALTHLNRHAATRPNLLSDAVDHTIPMLLPKLGEVLAVRPEPRVTQVVKVERLVREVATGRLLDVIA